MFSIKYEILSDERERISNMNSIESLEKNFDTIVGQIQLLCNNSEIGFVDKDIPYDGEPLFTWLKRLNQVVIQLKSNEVVCVHIPNSINLWIEIEKTNQLLKITKIRAKKEMHIQEALVNRYKECEECFWSEQIEITEFVNGVIDVTEMFVTEIQLINGLLEQNDTWKKFLNLFNNAKLR